MIKCRKDEQTTETSRWCCPRHVNAFRLTPCLQEARRANGALVRVQCPTICRKNMKRYGRSAGVDAGSTKTHQNSMNVPWRRQRMVLSAHSLHDALHVLHMQTVVKAVQSKTRRPARWKKSTCHRAQHVLMVAEAVQFFPQNHLAICGIITDS